jgi:hypothetical protein
MLGKNIIVDLCGAHADTVLFQHGVDFIKPVPPASHSATMAPKTSFIDLPLCVSIYRQIGRTQQFSVLALGVKPQGPVFEGYRKLPQDYQANLAAAVDFVRKEESCESAKHWH